MLQSYIKYRTLVGTNRLAEMRMHEKKNTWRYSGTSFFKPRNANTGTINDQTKANSLY